MTGKDYTAIYLTVHTSPDMTSYAWFDTDLERAVSETKALLADHGGTITIREVSAYSLAKHLDMVVGVRRIST